MKIKNSYKLLFLCNPYHELSAIKDIASFLSCFLLFLKQFVKVLMVKCTYLLSYLTVANYQLARLWLMFLESKPQPFSRQIATTIDQLSLDIISCFLWLLILYHLSPNKQPVCDFKSFLFYLAFISFFPIQSNASQIRQLASLLCLLLK